LGNEKLKQELLAQVSEKAGKSHYGEELRESAEAKAEQIVAEELRRLGWKEDELKRQRKGHRRKVQMARRLRAETTMSLKWIAERLAMGSASMVTHCLRQKGRCR
jgi:hypothetical protein